MPGKQAHGRLAGEELLPVKMAREKRSLLSQRHDGNGYGGLLDYEAAAAYLSTTPRHELWARRQLARTHLPTLTAARPTGASIF